MNLQEKIDLADKESNDMEKIEQAKEDFLNSEKVRLLNEYQSLNEGFFESKATKFDVYFWSFWAASMYYDYVLLRWFFIFVITGMLVFQTYKLRKKSKIMKELSALY